MDDAFPKSESEIETSYEVTTTALRILERNILGEGETPNEMLDRVCANLSAIETEVFGESPDRGIEEMVMLKVLFEEKKVILGAQALRGLGRGQPVSSTTVISVENLDDDAILDVCTKYFRSNQGIGFNLTDCEDPVRTLYLIDALASKLLAESDGRMRNVGNMAIISVDHPR